MLAQLRAFLLNATPEELRFFEGFLAGVGVEIQNGGTKPRKERKAKDGASSLLEVANA